MKQFIKTLIYSTPITVPLVLFIVFIVCGLFNIDISHEAEAASPTLQNKDFSVGSSKVHRLVDKEANVICYVIPQDLCVGDCAYSPAISCLMHGNVE